MRNCRIQDDQKFARVSALNGYKSTKDLDAKHGLVPFQGNLDSWFQRVRMLSHMEMLQNKFSQGTMPYILLCQVLEFATLSRKNIDTYVFGRPKLNIHVCINMVAHIGVELLLAPSAFSRTRIDKGLYEACVNWKKMEYN